MNLALCGIKEETAHELEQHDEYCILRFYDEPERRGDVKLAYFLRDGPPVDLAVVGYPGAEGLAACDYLRTQSRALPILWLCDRREFEPEAKRLGVAFYSTGPPGIERLVAGMLRARPPTEVGSTALLRQIRTKITIQCYFKNKGIEQWRELWK
ncbi:hypothetical protein [Marasmitruncus massiliensis]|jgi:hypothetical protein|uniref:hypothetical protein n=1 Tax=Marasmitruncus massiliensis TaxID=1944642 RepID=UPI001FA8540A|nr:hypothetical protein [Marasmitruncus massiliensis]